MIHIYSKLDSNSHENKTLNATYLWETALGLHPLQQSSLLALHYPVYIFWLKPNSHDPFFNPKGVNKGVTKTNTLATNFLIEALHTNCTSINS